MAHHKRHRPKNRRAGCLMCKPHKMNHARTRGFCGRDPLGVQRRTQESVASLARDEWRCRPPEPIALGILRQPTDF
jgi:hypothetical protein